jgi:hypothetical protein
LAKLMDSVFKIPGLRTRVGLDALLGLVPGLGDLTSSLVTLYILKTAASHGVSRWTLTRMAGNSLVDLTFGSLPVVGDLFDVYLKSNLRHVELLQRHLQSLESGAAPVRHDNRLFLAGIIITLLLALIGSVVVSWFLVTQIAGWLFPAAKS